MDNQYNSRILPLIPLRDIVVFPNMVAPLFVGRDKSVKALETAMNSDKQVLLVTQKDSALDDPQYEDLYDIGSLGKVLQLLRLPDGTVKVLIEGGKRVSIQDYNIIDDYIQSNYKNEPSQIKQSMSDSESRNEKHSYPFSGSMQTIHSSIYNESIDKK